MSNGRLGTKASGSTNESRRADAPTTGLLPRRETSHPVGGADSNTPTAPPSSASPSGPSLKASFSCKAGMRTTQVANPKPLRKKIPVTASRAALNAGCNLELEP